MRGAHHGRASKATISRVRLILFANQGNHQFLRRIGISGVDLLIKKLLILLISYTSIQPVLTLLQKIELEGEKPT